MLRVGLTGGIASGKSTVARIFRELGAHVLDADRIAREVVPPGSQALSRIARAFGKEMLRPDGTLDRAALGTLVFADAGKRRVLEGILHPLILDGDRPARSTNWSAATPRAWSSSRPR